MKVHESVLAVSKWKLDVHLRTIKGVDHALLNAMPWARTTWAYSLDSPWQLCGPRDPYENILALGPLDHALWFYLICLV